MVTSALSPSRGLSPTTLARMNSIAITTGLEGASQYSPLFGVNVRSTASGSAGPWGKYESWARPHNSRARSVSSVTAIAPDNEMNVFEETSPKQRQALGFAAISCGLSVERAVRKTIAFSFGRAMPRMGRARSCGPWQVVIMQVAMRSMFFQMKDSCSASDRLDDIFSFIVFPVFAESAFALAARHSKRRSRYIVPLREPLGVGVPRSRALTKIVSKTCNRFGFVALWWYGASISPQAMRSDSTAMAPPIAVVFYSIEFRMIAMGASANRRRPR